jgi:hypothetical protein
MPAPGVGRPRRFCCDDCRRQWHADTSIIRNELAWRLRLPTSANNRAEVARLERLVADRR